MLLLDWGGTIAPAVVVVSLAVDESSPMAEAEQVLSVVDMMVVRLFGLLVAK